MNSKDSDIEAMRKEFVTKEEHYYADWDLQQEIRRTDRELSLQIRILGISMLFYILISEIAK